MHWLLHLWYRLDVLSDPIGFFLRTKEDDGLKALILIGLLLVVVLLSIWAKRQADARVEARTVQINRMFDPYYRIHKYSKIKARVAVMRTVGDMRRELYNPPKVRR